MLNTTIFLFVSMNNECLWHFFIYFLIILTISFFSNWLTDRKNPKEQLAKCFAKVFWFFSKLMMLIQSQKTNKKLFFNSNSFFIPKRLYKLWNIVKLISTKIIVKPYSDLKNTFCPQFYNFSPTSLGNCKKYTFVFLAFDNNERIKVYFFILLFYPNKNIHLENMCLIN